MFKFTLTKSALALAALAGLGYSAPPLEKNGDCPTFTRTNFYNGIDLRAFNNLSGSPVSLRYPSPRWPIRPDSLILDQGLIQEPLTPQQSINCALTPPGLKPQIVASELTPGPAGAKGMAYPLYINFDEKGRMWAIDAIDYPYTHDSTGMPSGTGITTTNGLPTDRLTGKSRILIFEDTDGDGSLDKFKIFYQGFALATSFEFVKDGIAVMVPPYIYYVPRSTTNPDTAGAVPTAVVTGLSNSNNSYDTHFQPSSLTRNIDNWLYGHAGTNGCGASTVTVTNGTRSGNCGSGNSYRFKHRTLGSDTNRFEVRSGGVSNAHGLGIMEDGQIFKSAATVNPHIFHDVRPGVTALDIRVSASTASNRGRGRLFSLTRDRYMWEGNNDAIAAEPGSGNVPYYSSNVSAISGSDFYTARVLPEKYWNRFQFACEGLSGLCNQDSLTLNGSTWNSNRLYPGKGWPNIFASTDAWSAPLKIRTGPDGALWMIDFYNYIFLHNPAGPATNGAYRHPLRYKTRSRIYRILPINNATQPILDLTNANTAQLVAALYNPNLVWRMHAQRLLIEKGYNAEVGTLLQNMLTTRRSVDAAELDGPVINAIWTLQGMGQFENDPVRWDPILKSLLLHPAWTVRRNVLLAMPNTATTYASIREQCAVNDTHAHVRLQALEKLAQVPAAPGDIILSMEGLRVDGQTPNPSDNDTVRLTYLNDAYSAAGSSKVASLPGSSRPGTCPAYYPPANVKQDLGAHAPYKFSQDVRFATRAGGFDLISNANLPSGDLVVFDLRGKVAFRSTWNQSTLSWSSTQARKLAYPVYFYTFRGNAGQSFKGRVALGSF